MWINSLKFETSCTANTNFTYAYNITQQAFVAKEESFDQHIHIPRIITIK